METTKTIEFSTIGTLTKKSYSGSFRVKGLLTRRDQFLADANRRRIIGPNPADALPALQGEAYMLGQLQARTVEAPDWWSNAQSGELLEDGNVISELYELALKASDEVLDTINTQATTALEKLSKESK